MRVLGFDSEVRRPLVYETNFFRRVPLLSAKSSRQSRPGHNVVGKQRLPTT